MSAPLRNFVYVNQPVVTMKESQAEKATVVSEAIFSEKVTIEKRSGEWAYITTPDGYSGWSLAASLVERESSYETSLKVSRLAAHVYESNGTEKGLIKTLPYGARLHSLDETDERWIKAALPDGKECYIQKGDVAKEKKLQTKKDLGAFSKKFLDRPYTWGGRSSFGYDCSGFIQMLYAQIGIHLERDAKLQVKDSRFQDIPIEAAKIGDLLFFGNTKKKKLRILHVGMYIGNWKFIHTTVQENMPWLRISKLSDFAWSGHKDAVYPYRLARQLIKIKQQAQS